MHTLQFDERRSLGNANLIRVVVKRSRARVVSWTFGLFQVVVIICVTQTHIVKTETFAKEQARRFDSPYYIFNPRRRCPPISIKGCRIKRESRHDRIGVAIVHDVDRPLSQSSRTVVICIGGIDIREIVIVRGHHHHQDVQMPR